jgi:hypothetical protein
MTTSPQTPGQQQPPLAAPVPSAPVPGAAATSDEKTWGMLCHLAAFVCFVGIPFGNIVGPLIVWLIKKQEMPFVDDQGKESLNFQITMTLCGLVLGAMLGVSFLLIIVFIGFILIPIVGLAMLGLVIFDVVMVVMAAMKANAGERYRYPYSLRLIK